MARIDTWKMTTRQVVAEMKRLIKKGKRPYLVSVKRKTYIEYK